MLKVTSENGFPMSSYNLVHIIENMPKFSPKLQCEIKIFKIMISCKAGHFIHSNMTFKPPHDKTNKVACAPSEDSDQPGYLPSLIRVFAVRMMKA